MSLLHERAAFLRDVRKLLAFADDQKLIATAGELVRTPETQQQYVKDGASNSMDSMHLRGCAIDLMFFMEEHGELRLVRDDALEPLGTFWESQDPRNRWGGRRVPRKDTTHFERDLGAWPSTSESVLSPSASPSAMMPSAGDARPTIVTPASAVALAPGTISQLKRGSANSAAVTRLQDMLKRLGLLAQSAGVFDAATEAAVVAFQQQQGLVADGIVGEKTWSALSVATTEGQKQQVSRWLGDADLQAAADGLQLELAAVKAVYKVESAGSGFIGDRVKILFEGHVFWKQLQLRGLDPLALSVGNQDILYPKWTREFYVGGAGEWRRLERAQAINNDAALESASYGLFQIMGEHWKLLGYESVVQFCTLMGEHERNQLEAFCRFIQRTRSQGQPLVDLLKAKNWADFARAYNGPRYRENAYDDKLRVAYRKYGGNA